MESKLRHENVAFDGWRFTCQVKEEALIIFSYSLRHGLCAGGLCRFKATLLTC